jgi:predicted nucleotidyltransferase
VISSQQIDIIKSILEPFSPEYIGVFGSYARNEEKEGSDLDLLVKFGKRLNLFDLVGLEQELTEKLGIQVDLVTEKALSPLIKDFVTEDLKKIA